MATKVMSLRLPDDLREWVIAYAGERGVSQAVVISAAVREFRTVVRANLDRPPGLEQAVVDGGTPPEKRGGRGRSPAVPPPSVRAPVRKAVLVPSLPRPMGAMERQARLNAAKERNG